MLNHNDEYFEFDATKIHRLKSSLKNRLNLLNAFIPIIKRNHEPYTIDNIGVNLDKIEQIEDFMTKSTAYIENLSENFKEYFLSYGSDWQKSRLLK